MEIRLAVWSSRRPTNITIVYDDGLLGARVHGEEHARLSFSFHVMSASLCIASAYRKVAGRMAFGSMLDTPFACLWLSQPACVKRRKIIDRLFSSSLLAGLMTWLDWGTTTFSKLLSFNSARMASITDRSFSLGQNWIHWGLIGRSNSICLTAYLSTLPSSSLHEITVIFTVCQISLASAVWARVYHGSGNWGLLSHHNARLMWVCGEDVHSNMMLVKFEGKQEISLSRSAINRIRRQEMSLMAYVRGNLSHSLQITLLWPYSTQPCTHAHIHLQPHHLFLTPARPRANEINPIFDITVR